MLSGGERSRLALLTMLLKPANLLILDEPTNHLDLTSKDVLLEALKRFEGTVLFVSHDRDFIEALAGPSPSASRPGMPARWYVGDYRYYLDKKAALDAEASGGTAFAGASAGGASTGAAVIYGEDKARKARLRKLKKREEEILARLDAIGAQKKACEGEMGLPENYSDGDKMRHLQASLIELEKEAETLNTEWESLSEELSGAE